MVSRVEFDEKIKEIFGRAEYSHLKNSIQDFFSWLGRVITEWLESLLKSAGRAGSSSSIPEGLSAAFIVAGILLILAIIVFIAVKGSRVLERNRKLKHILGERINDKVTSGSLLHKSAEYDMKGDLRLSVRYSYISLLLLLHEKKLVFLEDTMTNLEILRDLEGRGVPYIKEFREASQMFDTTWYGHKLPSSEALGTWRETFGIFWEKVRMYEEKTLQ